MKVLRVLKLSLSTLFLLSCKITSTIFLHDPIKDVTLGLEKG